MVKYKKILVMLPGSTLQHEAKFVMKSPHGVLVWNLLSRCYTDTAAVLLFVNKW